MTHPVIAQRRQEREALLARGRAYCDRLAARLAVRAVVVFGSVARGDFNAWSDIDVLVIADDLPASGRERLALLYDPAVAGIQPVGFTTEEFAARRHQGDPIATEATSAGVILHGNLPAQQR